MPIENPQTTLTALYACRDQMLSGKGIANYSIGDRSFTFTSLKDIMDMISRYENAVVAKTPVYARLDAYPANFPPFPQG